MKKRLLSVFLAAVLLIGLLPALPSSAADESYTSGSYTYRLDDEGNAVITDYSGSDATLEIPAALDGHPVTKIGSNVFAYNKTLVDLILPKTLTGLFYHAFYGCTGLKSVYIPKALESVSDPFSGCSALETVTFEEGRTEIPARLFAYSGLREFSVPESVTSIGSYAFSNCKNLEQVTFPSKLTSIGNNAFEYCTALTAVELPKNLKELGNSAFRECTSLKSLWIPKTLESAYEPFIDCSALETVTFEEGRTEIPVRLFAGSGLREFTVPESVTSIGSYAFSNCDKLEQVTFPSKLTSIENSAFEYCTALTAVELPKSLKELGGLAFSHCTSLKSLWIPKALTDNGYSVFSDCTALTDISFEQGITKIADCQFEGAPIKSITIPNTVLTIGFRAFANCANLTEINIPPYVTEIGSYAFENCTGLTSLNLPKRINKLNSHAFGGCTGLKSVYIPKALEYASSPFWHCSALENVTYEAGRTTVPDGLFRGSGLREIALPENVTSIGSSAFADCTQLNRVILPEGIETIGGSAFSGCTGLTEIEFPNTVRGSWSNYSMLAGCTSLKSVKLSERMNELGDRFFADCTALEQIEIPDTVTTIGTSLFEGCTALKDVKLSTNLQSIPQKTFFNCVSLESIVAPYAVKKIENNAFGNCVSLKELTLLRKVAEADDNALSYPDQVTIYGIKGTYAEAYAGKIEAKFAAIDRPATAVSLPETASVEKYSRQPLPLSLSPIDCTDELVWKSSDESVATVDEDGRVYGTKDGVAVITVTAGRVSASCTLTVGTPSHTHSYTTVVTPPTCGVRGYTTYTCACGDSYVDNYTAALGHNYVDGLCTRCGAVQPQVNFTDVSTGVWYYNAVAYAVSNGLMNGVGNDEFQPEEGMTRSMLVTVLWRHEGSPNQGGSTFTDVPDGLWYSQAVAWAADNGIVTGVGNQMFQPNTQITREQIATILFRCAQQKGADTQARGDLSAFPDKDKVNGWAETALQWCVGEGLIGGTNENGKVYLDPQGTATRAQVAAILMRYIEKIDNQ